MLFRNDLAGEDCGSWPEAAEVIRCVMRRGMPVLRPARGTVEVRICYFVEICRRLMSCPVTPFFYDLPERGQRHWSAIRFVARLRGKTTAGAGRGAVRHY